MRQEHSRQITERFLQADGNGVLETSVEETRGEVGGTEKTPFVSHALIVACNHYGTEVQSRVSLVSISQVSAMIEMLQRTRGRMIASGKTEWETYSDYDAEWRVRDAQPVARDTEGWDDSDSD